MNGRSKHSSVGHSAAGGTKASVYGGQTFNKSVFPPTKYIQGLLNAYCPDTQFNAAEFTSAFQKARTPDFDAAFAAVTPDGASCGQQLCWCLLDIPAGTVLPLHAHKNLEVAWIVKGCMYEKAVVNASIPVERQTCLEIDWLDSTKAKLEERAYRAGSVNLNCPGSIHQVYTDKTEGCLMVILYSKDCTFIRATDPLLAHQLLPATPERGTTYQMVSLSRTPSSFSARDPRYARFRSGLMGRQQTPEVTVAQVVVKALSDCGVRDAIVYPGAKCIELLKVIDNNNYGVRGWLCRNEHAGAFAAEGYNKSQGERLCTIVTTSGPGATNLCTGIASAWRDGVPMIVLTSQVPTYKTGTAAFQEVPTTEIYKPITKGAFAVTSAEQAYETVIAACKLAVEGVNGPVLVDLPENIQAEMVSVPHRARHLDASIYARAPVGGATAAAAPTGAGAKAPVTAPLLGHFAGALAPQPQGIRGHTPSPISRSVMNQVLRHIKAAKRPVLLVGGGCVGCDEALLNELVDVLGVPVVYTYMGKGCISDDHPLCLGTIGVHGLFTANTAINQCDTVLALGTRFDERAACKSFELWQTPRTVIHVDIRPQEVMSGSHKNRITCSVVANVEDFVGVLLQHLYGLLEERNKTLSVPLASLGLSGELKDIAEFTVDEEDIAIIQETSQQQKAADTAAAAAAAAAADGKTQPSGYSQHPSNSDDDPTFAAAAVNADAAAAADLAEPSPFAANGAPASVTSDAAAAAMAPVHGDIPADMMSMVSMVSCADFRAGEFTYAAWAQDMADMKVRRWKSLMPVLSPKSELTTREMIHLLDSYLSTHGLEPIVSSDVGSHQCLMTQYLRLHHPRQWLNEGGLASMGCGMPAAIGAAMANPGKTCLAVCGDGGFVMTSQELMMAKVYRLDVKVIVTVNNRLQLVEQLEEETYDSLDVFTFLGDPDHPNRPYPHFSKLAEAYGVPALTAWTKQELLEGLGVMFSRPGPFLLEVVALAERPQIRYWDDSEQ